MSDSAKAREQYELYRYCREEGGHENFLREFEVAKRYYASNQWLDQDRKQRTAEGRLTFEVNEVFRTINAVRGELNQLVSDVRFDPTNGDPEVARVLNRLNDHTDRQNKMYMHDDRVLLDGILGGRGFYRTRVDFDENMQGHVSVRRQRPENTILDFNIDSPDPDTWDRIFTTEVVSLDDIENMFGKEKARHFSETPYVDWLQYEDRSLTQSLGLTMADNHDLSGRVHKHHRLISQQFREFKYKECFVDPVTGDISEIPESWSREKISNAIRQFNLATMRRKIKTIRWRVTCNDIVLHDEDSPYKHFDIVPFMPWFIDNHALSLFTVLRGPQDLLNYTVSEETHILGTTAHSGWKVKAGSLRNMTSRQLEEKGAKSGLVLELDDVGDAERITPGQPATGFQQFGDRARSWINDLASVSQSMLGTQSEYANGANIGANLQRAPVNLHAPLTAFAFAKQLLAERKLDLFQSFYTETRIMRIAESNFGQTEEVAINMPDPATGKIIHDLTIGKYSVRLMPVGSKQSADEFSFDQLVQMRELGITVPTSLFVTTSALNAKPEVMEQLLAANGGEVNPEEQRAAELELERMELEIEDLRAGIDSKAAASELARGRAAKAAADAQYDPRPDKVQLDLRRIESEDSRARLQIEAQRERDTQKTAVDLTKVATQAQVAEKTAKERTVAAKKAPAKKATKKATKKVAARTT